MFAEKMKAMKTCLLFFLFCLFILLPVRGGAQYVSVSGVVRNQTTGETKSNVNVYEAQSGIGTITNRDGHYRLVLSSGKRQIEISSPGYNTFSSTFNLLSDTIISVSLTPLNIHEEANTENEMPSEQLPAEVKPLSVQPDK